MPRYIIVKIEKATAKTTIEAVGFNGSGCREATKDLENSLGSVSGRETKPVMWNATATDTQKTITVTNGR